MPNYKLTIEYNGEDFCGSQKQIETRTVQGELEKALETYFKQTVATVFSSRTDAGVHALGQVVSFQLNSAIPEQDLDTGKLLISLNGILPQDIAAAKIETAADDFHPRFDAKSREYLYKIFTRRHKPVLRLDSLYWEREPLDYEAMAKHAESFLGTHDFKDYSKVENAEEEKSYECTVTKSELIRESDVCIKYKIKANRFLRHMVRRIVAELVELGKGKSDYKGAGMLPSSGLTLVKVEY